MNNILICTILWFTFFSDCFAAIQSKKIESFVGNKIEKIDTNEIIKLCQDIYFDELENFEDFKYYVNVWGTDNSKKNNQEFRNLFKGLIIIESIDQISENIFLVDITFKASIFSTRFIVNKSLSYGKILSAGSGSEICISNNYNEILEEFKLDTVSWRLLFHYLIPLSMNPKFIEESENGTFPKYVFNYNKNEQFMIIRIDENLQLFYYDTINQWWVKYICSPIDDHVNIMGISKYKSIPAWKSGP